MGKQLSSASKAVVGSGGSKEGNNRGCNFGLPFVTFVRFPCSPISQVYCPSLNGVLGKIMIGLFLELADIVEMWQFE